MLTQIVAFWVCLVCVSGYRVKVLSPASFSRLSTQRSQRSFLWPDFLSGKNQANSSVRQRRTLLIVQLPALSKGLLELVSKKAFLTIMICGVRLVNSSRVSRMAVLADFPSQEIC